MSVSLKTKFRVLFAALILFAAAAGWLVVDRLAVVNSASGAIVERLMPIRSDLAAASRDVTRFRLAEARHILSTNDAAIAAEDANLRRLHAAVDAALQSALGLLQGGDEAREVAQLRAEWDAFVNDQEAVLVLSRANSNDAAFALYGKSTARFDAMDQRFDALSDRVAAQVSAARDASRRVYATVAQGSAWVVGGVLLAALAAAFYFERNVTRAILRLCGCMGKLAEGDLSIEVPERNRGDELGMMAKTVQTFRDNGLAMRRMEAEAAEQRALVDAQRAQADAERAASAEQRAAAEAERQRAAAEREAAAALQAEAMAALASGLAELANGNLTIVLERAFAPDYERVRVDFNAAVSGVQATVRAIMTHSAAIAQGISEIAGGADDLAHRTEQQAAGLQQTAAALDEITARVKNAAENSGEAQTLAGQAQSETQTSETVVSQAVSAMGEIESSARQIGQIIGVIDEIAFQTNLLALNAGVEAARAGEAGRGFAVVASEVRALAQRAADAAKEIKTLVTRSMRQVETGVQLVGATGEALGRIQAGVRRINTAIGAIADSAREQAGGLTEINTAINQMDRVTQQNAAMVEQSTAAVHSLSHEIEFLNQAISRFRIDAPSPDAMPPDSRHSDAMRRPRRAEAA